MVDEVGSTESEGGFEMGMIFGAWGMREKMTDGTTQNFGAGSLGAWGVREDDEDEDDSSDGEFRSLVFLEPGVEDDDEDEDFWSLV